MSHTATVTTKLRSIPLLKSALDAMAVKGATFEVGDFKQRFYSSDVQGNVKIKFPTWTYPVIVDTKTGTAHYDNFNGLWGDIKDFDTLNQEYGLAVAEQEAQEFVMSGWTLERMTQPNGDVQLVLEKA